MDWPYRWRYPAFLAFQHHGGVDHLTTHAGRWHQAYNTFTIAIPELSLVTPLDLEVDGFKGPSPSDNRPKTQSELSARISLNSMMQTTILLGKMPFEIPSREPHVCAKAILKRVFAVLQPQEIQRPQGPCHTPIEVVLAGRMLHFNVTYTEDGFIDVPVLHSHPWEATASVFSRAAQTLQKCSVEVSWDETQVSKDEVQPLSPHLEITGGSTSDSLQCKIAAAFSDSTGDGPDGCPVPCSGLPTTYLPEPLLAPTDLYVYGQQTALHCHGGNEVAPQGRPLPIASSHAGLICMDGLLEFIRQAGPGQVLDRIALSLLSPKSSLTGPISNAVQPEPESRQHINYPDHISTAALLARWALPKSSHKCKKRNRCIPRTSAYMEAVMESGNAAEENLHKRRVVLTDQQGQHHVGGPVKFQHGSSIARGPVTLAHEGKDQTGGVVLVEGQRDASAGPQPGVVCEGPIGVSMVPQEEGKSGTEPEVSQGVPERENRDVLDERNSASPGRGKHEGAGCECLPSQLSACMEKEGTSKHNVSSRSDQDGPVPDSSSSHQLQSPGNPPLVTVDHQNCRGGKTSMYLRQKDEDLVPRTSTDNGRCAGGIQDLPGMPFHEESQVEDGMGRVFADDPSALVVSETPEDDEDEDRAREAMKTSHGKTEEQESFREECVVPFKQEDCDITSVKDPPLCGDSIGAACSDPHVMTSGDLGCAPATQCKGGHAMATNNAKHGPPYEMMRAAGKDLDAGDAGWATYDKELEQANLPSLVGAVDDVEQRKATTSEARHMDTVQDQALRSRSTFAKGKVMSACMKDNDGQDLRPPSGPTCSSQEKQPAASALSVGEQKPSQVDQSSEELSDVKRCSRVLDFCSHLPSPSDPLCQMSRSPILCSHPVAIDQDDGTSSAMETKAEIVGSDGQTSGSSGPRNIADKQQTTLAVAGVAIAGVDLLAGTGSNNTCNASKPDKLDAYLEAKPEDVGVHECSGPQQNILCQEDVDDGGKLEEVMRQRNDNVKEEDMEEEEESGEASQPSTLSQFDLPPLPEPVLPTMRYEHLQMALLISELSDRWEEEEKAHPGTDDDPMADHRTQFSAELRGVSHAVFHSGLTFDDVITADICPHYCEAVLPVMMIKEDSSDRQADSREDTWKMILVQCHLHHVPMAHHNIYQDWTMIAPAKDTSPLGFLNEFIAIQVSQVTGHAPLEQNSMQGLDLRQHLIQDLPDVPDPRLPWLSSGAEAGVACPLAVISCLTRRLGSCKEAHEGTVQRVPATDDPGTSYLKESDQQARIPLQACPKAPILQYCPRGPAAVEVHQHHGTLKASMSTELDPCLGRECEASGDQNKRRRRADTHEDHLEHDGGQAARRRSQPLVSAGRNSTFNFFLQLEGYQAGATSGVQDDVAKASPSWTPPVLEEFPVVLPDPHVSLLHHMMRAQRQVLSEIDLDSVITTPTAVWDSTPFEAWLDTAQPGTSSKLVSACTALAHICHAARCLIHHGITISHLYLSHVHQHNPHCGPWLESIMVELQRSYQQAEARLVEDHPQLSVLENVLKRVGQQEEGGPVLLMGDPTSFFLLYQVISSAGLRPCQVDREGALSSATSPQELRQQLQQAAAGADCVLVAAKLAKHPSFPFSLFPVVLELVDPWGPGLCGHIQQCPGQKLLSLKTSLPSLSVQKPLPPLLASQDNAAQDQNITAALQRRQVEDILDRYLRSPHKCTSDSNLDGPPLLINCESTSLVKQRPDLHEALVRLEQCHRLYVVERATGLAEVVITPSTCLSVITSHMLEVSHEESNAMSNTNLPQSLWAVVRCLHQLSYAYQNIIIVLEVKESQLMALLEKEAWVQGLATKIGVNLQWFASSSPEMTKALMVQVITAMMQKQLDHLAGGSSPCLLLPDLPAPKEVFFNTFLSLNPLSSQLLLSLGLTMREVLAKAASGELGELVPELPPHIVELLACQATAVNINIDEAEGSSQTQRMRCCSPWGANGYQPQPGTNNSDVPVDMSTICADPPYENGVGDSTGDWWTPACAIAFPGDKKLSDTALQGEEWPESAPWGIPAAANDPHASQGLGIWARFACSRSQPAAAVAPCQDARGRTGNTPLAGAVPGGQFPLRVDLPLNTNSQLLRKEASVPLHDNDLMMQPTDLGDGAAVATDGFVKRGAVRKMNGRSTKLKYGVAIPHHPETNPMVPDHAFDAAQLGATQCAAWPVTTSPLLSQQRAYRSKRALQQNLAYGQGAGLTPPQGLGHMYDALGRGQSLGFTEREQADVYGRGRAVPYPLHPSDALTGDLPPSYYLDRGVSTPGCDEFGVTPTAGHLELDDVLEESAGPCSHQQDFVIEQSRTPLPGTWSTDPLMCRALDSNGRGFIITTSGDNDPRRNVMRCGGNTREADTNACVLANTAAASQEADPEAVLENFLQCRQRPRGPVPLHGLYVGLSQQRITAGSHSALLGGDAPTKQRGRGQLTTTRKPVRTRRKDMPGAQPRPHTRPHTMTLTDLGHATSYSPRTPPLGMQQQSGAPTFTEHHVDSSLSPFGSLRPFHLPGQGRLRNATMQTNHVGHMNVWPGLSDTEVSANHSKTFVPDNCDIGPKISHLDISKDLSEGSGSEMPYVGGLRDKHGVILHQKDRYRSLGLIKSLRNGDRQMRLAWKHK